MPLDDRGQDPIQLDEASAIIADDRHTREAVWIEVTQNVLSYYNEERETSASLWKPGLRATIVALASALYDGGKTERVVLNAETLELPA